MTANIRLDDIRSRLRPAQARLEDDVGGPPSAAVAIIIDAERMGGSILMIRRVEREGDPWSGQIAFPGGHKASGDQGFLDTAIREANEEVGIQLRSHELLGMLSVMTSHSKRVRVAPFVFQLKQNVFVHPNQEVAEHFWVPLNDLSDAQTMRCTVDAIEGKLTADAYVYKGNVIWGLTFRIINVLLGRESLSMI